MIIRTTARLFPGCGKSLLCRSLVSRLARVYLLARFWGNGKKQNSGDKLLPMRKLWGFIFLSVSIVLLLSAASSLSAAASIEAHGKNLEPVRIGYSGIGITHDLLKIMGAGRIFEK